MVKSLLALLLAVVACCCCIIEAPQKPTTDKPVPEVRK